MWGLLRIVLLIANAALMVFFAYLYSNKGPPQGGEALPVYGIAIFLVLNFVYLLLSNQLPDWRIFRLISLWFDAKESELRQRANRSRQEK